MTESTALTVQQRAVQALGMAEIASQLTELASKSTSIVAITNADGYEQCRSARITLKNQRVEIEKRGKAARDDANAFAKAVIAEEKKLIDIIQPEEKRLQAIESAHEAKIEAEEQRQAAERAELDRQRKAQEDEALLRSMIASFVAIPANAAGKSSIEIAQIIENTKAIVIGDEFGALRDEAQKAVDLALRLLPSIHAHAAHFEAEEEKERQQAIAVAPEVPEAEVTGVVRPDNESLCKAIARVFEVTHPIAHEWLMDYASFEK